MRYAKIAAVVFFYISFLTMVHAQTGSTGTGALSSPLFGKVSSVIVTTGSGWTSAELVGESGATIMTGVVQINGNQVVPPLRTNASGTGIFSINTTSHTLSYNITFSGLTSSESASHIHGPADATTNSGILFPLPTGTSKVGIWNYPQSLENDILSGKTYVNIHSSTYPDGEIRGQIYFPTRLALASTGTQSILEEIASKLGTNTDSIRPIVIFASETSSETTASGSTQNNSGTTTQISGTWSDFIEKLRIKGEWLRNAYAGIFDDFGKKLDRVRTDRKEYIFNALIDKIDTKIMQIQNSTLPLESKQKFLLLYGDLRLMIQNKLTTAGVKIQSEKTKDELLKNIPNM